MSFKMEGGPKEITALSYELIYRRYLFNKDREGKFPRELNTTEYIALHIIRDTEEKQDIYSGRTYLQEMAEQMQLSIRQVSKMAGQLRDRGLLTWSHDGDGSEGTYVTLTESGANLLTKAESNLKEYYGRVIEKFGRDNLIQMLQLMKQLETVVSAEREEMEEQNGESGSVE